jgi:hypothetical protein
MRGDQLFLLVEYVALDQTFGLSSTNHSCFTAQFRIPDRPKGIDLQLDGGSAQPVSY